MAKKFNPNKDLQSWSTSSNGHRASGGSGSRNSEAGGCKRVAIVAGGVVLACIASIVLSAISVFS